MRVRWRNFSKGLFAGGSREAVPEGFVRRLVGFSHMLNDYVRTRFRHEGRLITEASRAVHSIFRTGNSIFYGADRGYGTGTPGTAGGAADTGTAIYTHANNVLLGTDTNNIIRRLAFFSGRSVAGKGTQDEFVYVAGGGQLFKHKKTAKVASDLSRWGIPAPTVALTGVQRDFQANQNYFYPLTFNSTTGWTFTNIVGQAFPANDSLEGNIGNSCLAIEVGTNKSGKAFYPFGSVQDFTKFPNGQPLSPQDWFVIDIKVSNVTSLDTIELKFFNDPSGQGSLAGDGVNLSALSVTLVADDALVQQNATGANGLADIPEIADDETSFLTNPPNGASGTSKAIIERLGSTRLGGENQWMRLRIPRSSFSYSNPTAIGLQNGWKTVTAFEAIITTNKEEDNVTVRFNNGGFVGGVGMQGKYKYCYTLKDPNTKHRSNPSPIVEIDAPFRTGVSLNLPLAPLSDIDKNTRGQTTNFLLHTGAGLIREIWRTMGNGAQFFKCGEIPAANNAVTLVYDSVADFRGMRDLDPSPSGLGGTTQQWIMNGFLDPTEVLQFDNIAPSHGFMDCFGLAYGRLFWTRDETPDPNDATNFPGKGRLYFSPAGRLESVESFINVTHGGDDATQKGVIWNGIYVFSQRRCFEILGTDVPFSAREILGVPGTLWPYTVVPTPYGIVYEAMDGLRVFDGSSSTLLPMEPVAPFFRRDTNARKDAGFPDVGTISGSVQTNVNHMACFVADEYRWSDGVTFLAFNLRTGVWRQVSAAQANFPTALYVEPVFGECYGGRVGGISSLEFGSVGGDYTTSSGTTTAIAYEFETPGWLVDGRPTFYVQRLYVDATIRSGETVTVALCTEDGAPGVGPTATTIGTISGTGSRKLYEVNVGCQYVAVASVRLTGSTTSTGSTRIHGVEMDVHVPEEPGFGT